MGMEQTQRWHLTVFKGLLCPSNVGAVFIVTVTLDVGGDWM